MQHTHLSSPFVGGREFLDLDHSKRKGETGTTLQPGGNFAKGYFRNLAANLGSLRMLTW